MSAPGGRRQRVAVYGICLQRPAGGHGHTEERILLVRASSMLTVAGRWFLPGGGIEHGEHPVDGLRREFAEETGLSVHKATLLGVLSDLTTVPDGVQLHTVRIVYRVDEWSGELRAEQTGSSDAVRWVDRSRVAGIGVMPYVARALAEFADPAEP